MRSDDAGVAVAEGVGSLLIVLRSKPLETFSLCAPRPYLPSPLFSAPRSPWTLATRARRARTRRLQRLTGSRAFSCLPGFTPDKLKVFHDRKRLVKVVQQALPFPIAR